MTCRLTNCTAPYESLLGCATSASGHGSSDHGEQFRKSSPSICQHVHSRLPALSFATDRDSPGARDDIQHDKYGWMQDAFPPQYKPCDSPDSANAYSRFQKRRSQDQEQSTAVYVPCDADIRLVFRPHHRILREVSRVRGSLRTRNPELRAHQIARRLRSARCQSAQKSDAELSSNGYGSAKCRVHSAQKSDVSDLMDLLDFVSGTVSPSAHGTSSVTMFRAVPPLLFWLFRTLVLFTGGIQRYVLYGQYCSRGAGVLTCGLLLL